MDKRDEDEIRDFWNRIADDWNIQVGLEGDSNRILNSDPVLWAFAGNVRGRKVLDAGCGTGYLSKQASDRGALVTGVDFSDRMIEIARANHPSIDFRVDSCIELRTVGDAQFDIVIANYVLMDIPELEATMHAFSRVLRNEGLAVLVFSHPAHFGSSACDGCRMQNKYARAGVPNWRLKHNVQPWSWNKNRGDHSPGAETE
jgi:ubiquinone/menaquinone biosynthesis C-methylase UbiE